MSAEIQTLPDGTEALVVTTGTVIEVFALDVIASYSELLGEPDPGKTVVLIRGAMKTKDQTGLWGPLYESLSEGLGELVEAGVPPEMMPDLMEEATGSPVPRRAKARQLRAAQQAAKDRLAKGSNQGAAEFSALLAGRLDTLRESRAAFLKEITPPRREPVRAAASPFTDRLLVDQQPETGGANG